MESGSNPITPKRKVEKSSKQLFKSPLTCNRNKNVTFNNDNSDPFVTPKRKPKSDIDMTESESRTPDGSFLSPSSENVKVDEILEKYKTNCSRHKIVDMAKFLGINRNTLTKKISRAKAVVTNIKKDPNLCHFCENTVSPNISKSTKHTKMDSIIDSIKDLSYYEKSVFFVKLQ